MSLSSKSKKKDAGALVREEPFVGGIHAAIAGYKPGAAVGSGREGLAGIGAFPGAPRLDGRRGSKDVAKAGKGLK